MEIALSPETRPCSPAAGFTLLELLVVMVLIGLLGFWLFQL